jgi:hypothetical protein
MTPHAIRRIALVVAVLASTAAAHPASGAPEDELVVIVNVANTESISASQLESVFLRKENHWSNGDQVVPFNLPPESKVRLTFDRAVLGMSADETARYWLDQRIRSGITAPRELGDVSLIVRLVARLAGGIGYVPSSSDLRGVRVIARIRGDKVTMP